jgi:cytidylate kinase
MAKENGISQEKARNCWTGRRDRKIFVQTYFHVNIDDAVYYDMIFNTQYIKPDQVVTAVKAALKFKKMPARRRFDPKPETA